MSGLPAAAAAFLLHGAGTLLLESVWVRSQGALFGATPAVAGSVLLAYFAGTALGSWRWRGGQIARRSSFVPVAAALAAGAALPWLPAAAGALAVAGKAQSLLAPPALWAVAGLLVLPACVAIGAFFPLIGRVGGARAPLLLYALEAAGGLPGVALGSLVFPRWLGCRATAAAGAAALLAAWALLRRAGDAPATDAPPAPAPGAPASAPETPWRGLALAAGSGVCSLLLQSVWMRLVALRSDNSVFAFGAVSLLLMLLLAVASAVVSRLPDRLAHARRAPTLVLAATVAGGLAAGALWLRLTERLSIRLVTSAAGLGEAFRLAAPLVATGSLAASLVLPLVLRRAAGAAPGPAARGNRLGLLIAVNGLGCAAGAAAAAFVLLPLAGVWVTLTVALAGYLALLAIAGGGWVAAAALAAGILALAVANQPANPVVTPTDPFGGPPGALVSVAEGAHGVVSVVDYPAGVRALWLNNTYLLEAFTGDPRATTRMGILPAVLRPAAADALMIGVGTGVSASGLLGGGVRRLDLAELIPEVAEAARRHFAERNGALLDDPRQTLFVGDGRLLLARTARRYDLVATDLVTPWNEGAAALYTREQFSLVRARLRQPGGIFCLWLPLYQLSRTELLAIARTMTEVFPAVTLWSLGSRTSRAAAALVGAEGPIDLPALARALRGHPQPPDDSVDPLLLHESAAVALYVGPVEPGNPLLRRAPVNTLDRPVVELLAARPGRALLQGSELLALLDEFYRAEPNPGGRYFAGWGRDADEWRAIGRDTLLYSWYLEHGDAARAQPLEARIGSLPAYRER